ncbi:MAG: hypothetical protein ACI9MR_004639, partial [Myxococcota bacterium]
MRAWLSVCAGVAVIVGGGVALGQPSDGDARDEAIFGSPADGDDADTSREDAIFGGDDSDDTRDPSAAPATGDRETDIFGSGSDPDSGRIELGEDPLTIGGQLYLRFASTLQEDMAFGDMPLSMPNLLDLYLDARPDDRVRGFFNGRLRFDPTVRDGQTSLFGQSVEPASVSVDQLWLKTDIARTVYLTIGQQRLKWGASRLWNPTDFVNTTRREPLSLFDERTGAPLVKAHIPIESLGWNAYAILLLDGVETLEDVGAALRLEMAFDRSEFAVSSVFGKGRKTSFGLDVSAGVGEIDVTAEIALTDERDSDVFSGTLDIINGEVPTASKRDAWIARASMGASYTFRPNDDDLMTVGVEYFYNPLGYSDASLYPFLLAVGALEPFYAGEHYAGLFWLVPSPGDWDDVTFTLSTIGNLSDPSFVSRLDVSAQLHTRLQLQTYAQVHYGKRGGEFRFGLDAPNIPAIPGLIDEPIEAFSV